jgi:hypothetical protein
MTMKRLPLIVSAQERVIGFSPLSGAIEIGLAGRDG